VLLITVDTLRADRMSASGYPRRTSPNLDPLLLEGVNFVQARTVEPLTNPSIGSLLTSLPPHRHGATRNGLRIHPGLPSLPRILGAHGYRTAAFVGNWTLRDRLSGLAEHFEVYEEVLTRARWFGVVRREATADDLTERAAEWIWDHLAHSDGRPFLTWVHYVEPHAPYRLQARFAPIIEEDRRVRIGPEDRYDTEIAFVDAAIGELLRRVEQVSPRERTLIVFLSDHGESLGEHHYWGHGRHLYETTLRIPMALYWKGRLTARAISAPALNIDLAPTILRLLGLPVPEGFEGFDWTPVLEGAPAPADRVTHYEAHRGVVVSGHASELAREAGLLELARLQGGRKEILSVKRKRRLVFDLIGDPGELCAIAPIDSPPSADLAGWMHTVVRALDSEEQSPAEPLDEKSRAALRSLGYVD
jgi:arylsulfatase A-like enzyme